jgi:hypothetical protein
MGPLLPDAPPKQMFLQNSVQSNDVSDLDLQLPFNHIRFMERIAGIPAEQ